MKLLVFKKDGGFTSTIIKMFNEQGYAHLLDGVHVNDQEFLKKNFSLCPHLFVNLRIANLVVWPTFHRYGDYSHEKTPDFVIYFDEVEVLSWDDWQFLKDYFLKLFSYGELPFVDKRGDYLLSTAIAPEEVNWSEMNVDYARSDVTEDGDADDYYDFKSFIVPDRDVGIFEITKPFTNLPYTMVIRNFSKVGYLPLFSGFYIEMSWGVSTKDDAYLRFLWEKLEMEGECDLEKLQRDRALKCYPAQGHVPEPQPEVYRKTIDQVRMEFDMKETGKDFRFY
jgi:hypothetical protein